MREIVRDTAKKGAHTAIKHSDTAKRDAHTAKKRSHTAKMCQYTAIFLNYTAKIRLDTAKSPPRWGFFIGIAKLRERANHLHLLA